MVKDLAKYAKEHGVKYFMISYTDLFGGQRAKLVPAQAINDMAVDGAGFAGFATWLDLTAAHPDMMAVPDASSVIQLPWKPGGTRCGIVMRACGSRSNRAASRITRSVVWLAMLTT